MTLAPELFTAAWAQAFCQALNANPRYRQVARSWEGALLLVIEADPARGFPQARAVWLDLHHGQCRGASTQADESRAAYVLRAAPATWKAILQGQLPPIAAILRGSLRLTKGNMMALVPHVRAAQELVATAARLPTTFPPGW